MTQTLNVALPDSLAQLVTLARQGTEVLLTEGNRPLARLVPVNASPRPRIAGLHTGMVEVSDDFDAPLSEEFWIGRL